jgi:outer membrane protein assembly factor BamB
MATNQLRRVLQTLSRADLHPEVAGQTDGQLLESYVRSREEAAFAALVRRHGPMVWGVCRRVLSHHDAEDAFQATFLVLVRKAASVVPQDKVANWLYGVARQTALYARATAAKRGARERPVMALPEPAQQQVELWDDVQPLLDQELGRLPDKYRAVLVLCDLQGKTRKEAARHFRLPEGTVASRLATARTMLAKRLARCGLAVPGGAVAALLVQEGASASVPPLAASATIQAATSFAAGQAANAGVISAKAVRLAEKVLRSMLVTKLKMATALLVVVASLGAGAAALTRQGPSDPEVPAEKNGKKDIAEVVFNWPQWRGPSRDGVVQGVTVPAKWPRTLTEEWRVPVGTGVASPVVVGGDVYVFVREKDDELVVCLDLRSGKERWRSEPYPAPYKPGPGEGTAEDRPRSTPAVAGGRVFTLGMSGILSCLDARTGKRLWRKDTKGGYYGGSSPLVTDGLCIAHLGDGAKSGGLTAFDVQTGEMKWCFSEGYTAMSGSPILADLAGERQLVTYSAWNAAGVSLATGKKLWGVGPGGAGMPCTTPVLYKDLLILADNLDSPRALRLEKGDKGITAKEVWKVKGLPLYYSSPVVAGDLVFGMSTRNGGCFFCLDASTGKTHWESEGRQGGYASILNAGSVLLFLTDRGRLLIVKPSATAFERIAEYHVSDAMTEAHPVFLGDRILIKDISTLTSFRIEPDSAKP